MNPAPPVTKHVIRRLRRGGHRAAPQARARLEHESSRFVDAHDIASHSLVSERERLASQQLTRENRYDRSARSDHVTESHRCEAGTLLSADLVGRSDEP